MEKKETFRLATGYSVYDNGDFSEVHFDGINPGRACVIIIYFGDPKTYQEGDGGELFLGHNILHQDAGIKFEEKKELKTNSIVNNWLISISPFFTY